MSILTGPERRDPVKARIARHRHPIVPDLLQQKPGVLFLLKNMGKGIQDLPVPAAIPFEKQLVAAEVS